MQCPFRRTMTQVGISALAAKREGLVMVRAANPALIQLPRLFHSSIPTRRWNPWRGLCLGLNNRHAAVNRQLKASCVCRQPFHSACVPHFLEAQGNCGFPFLTQHDCERYTNHCPVTRRRVLLLLRHSAFFDTFLSCRSPVSR
jgi:hypothetical protein